MIISSKSPILLDLEQTSSNNRNKLLEGLSADIQIASFDYQKVAILLVDLKQFRQINFSHGFNIGDEILLEIQSEIAKAIKKTSIVGRIFDNTFAVVIPDIKSPAFIQLAADKIRRTLSGFKSKHQSISNLEAHIGAAIYPESEMSAEGLLKKSELSLYLSKSNHSLSIEIPTIETNKAEDRWRIGKLLEKALANDELDYFYQPKVSLKGELKADCTEALIRWNSKELGHVMPDNFIPAAEEFGIIHKISEWGIRRAAQDKLEFDNKAPPITLSINLSASDVYESGLVESLDSAIAIWGINPTQITVEITESTILKDLNTATNVLNIIREKGIKVSIDDFGTGYSSLAYFKSIPADELKIDKSFVLNMTKNPADKIIVELVISLAKKFGLSVVAEGVEDKQTLHELMAMGCDYAQGYYFSKPIPKDMYIKWINDYNSTDYF
jgi:diguanylate cyclase (GGDEF)-like protein